MPQTFRLRFGFSLLESLISIFIIATLVALAIPHLGRPARAPVKAKLSADVATLNRALAIYEANGGDLSPTAIQAFDSSAKPVEQKILNKLKTRRTQDSAAKFAGMTEDMVDPRLVIDYHQGPGLDSETQRAVWNPKRKRFEVRSQGPGVVRFYFEEALASTDFGTEDRSASAINFNAKNGWVWAYEESPSSQPQGSVAFSPGGSPIGPVAVLTGGQLQAPIITPPSATYPITSFPLQLTVDNPNPQASSMVMLSVGGAPFTSYSGPVSISGPATASAFVVDSTGNLPNSALSSTTYTLSQKALLPPSLNPPGGTFPANEFPFKVSAHNPNIEPSGTQLVYSLNNGSPQLYTEPLTITALTAIEIHAVDPLGAYLQSPSVLEEYSPAALRLAPPKIVIEPVAQEYQATISRDSNNPTGVSTVLYAASALGDPMPAISEFKPYAEPPLFSMVDFPFGVQVFAYEKSEQPAVWLDSEIAQNSDFFGIPPQDGTLFILDFSGSMNREMVSGASRAEVLKQQFEASIHGLKDGVSVGVIIFNTWPIYIGESGPEFVSKYTKGPLELITLDSSTRATLISTVNSIEANQYTNYLRALSAVGLVSPKPSQIIFISDGAPNLGHGYNDKHNEWIKGMHIAKATGAPIHTVMIEPSRNKEFDRLEYIASETGGTSRIVGNSNLTGGHWNPSMPPKETHATEKYSSNQAAEAEAEFLSLMF